MGSQGWWHANSPARHLIIPKNAAARISRDKDYSAKWGRRDRVSKTPARLSRRVRDGLSGLGRLFGKGRFLCRWRWGCCRGRRCVKNRNNRAGGLIEGVLLLRSVRRPQKGRRTVSAPAQNYHVINSFLAIRAHAPACNMDQPLWAQFSTQLSEDTE